MCCRTLFRSHGPTTCNYFSSCAILHPIPMSIGVRFSITPRVCFQWVSWERLLWRESFRINRPLIPPFSWATALHILHFEYCLHIEVKSQGAFVHQTQFFKANFWLTYEQLIPPFKCTNIAQFAHWTLHTQRTKIIYSCTANAVLHGKLLVATHLAFQLHQHCTFCLLHIFHIFCLHLEGSPTDLDYLLSQRYFCNSGFAWQMFGMNLIAASLASQGVIG